MTCVLTVLERTRLGWMLLATIALLACSEARNSTGSISQRIGEITHTPGSTELDLSKLTSFGWEYFHVSKPGVTREEVCKLIGAGRNVCGRVVRVEKAPDDHVFLIFGLNGQLTHIELHALESGQFDLPSTEQAHPKSKAVFRIRRSASGSGKDRIFLEPK